MVETAEMVGTAEKNQRLWVVVIAPLIWAAHFLLSYATAAIWCAKGAGPGVTLQPVRVTIAAYTALAIAGIGLTGWRGHRRYSRRYEAGGAVLSEHGDTPEDRHRFLGLATLLLSALSAVATLYAALVTLFFASCD